MANRRSSKYSNGIMRNQFVSDSSHIYRARLWILPLLAVFAVSRWIYFLIGIRFDANPLLWFWHYIDPYLLQNDLWQSIYYLHIQPPLFNLWLGLSLKIAPSHLVLIFQTTYLVIGALFCVCLFLTLKQFDVSSPISFCLASLFCISPSTVLYENWLNYTYPAAFLVCLSTFALLKLIRTERKFYAFGFFFVMCVLILTRSLYQPVWYVLIAGGLILTNKALRKRIALCSVIAFLPVLLLLTKNYLVFGEFSSSSWLGMGMFRVATHTMTLERKEELIRQGILSELSLIRSYNTIPAYRQFLSAVRQTDIPALDQENKSTGFTNYNYLGYLNISRLYFHEALSILLNHPRYYFEGLRASLVIYLRSSADFQFSRYNYGKIAFFSALFDRIIYWELPDRLGGICLFVGLFSPLLLLFSILDLRKSPLRAAVMFICFTVIYVTVVANAFELSENNRYRYEIDSLLLLLFGLFAQKMLNRMRLKYQQ